MKIQNKYHKKLGFEVDGKPFGIEANEIKTVGEELGRKLLKNYWIEEIKEIITPNLDLEINEPEIPKYISKIERKKIKVDRYKIKTK